MSRRPTASDVMRLSQIVNVKPDNTMLLSEAVCKPCEHCDSLGLRVEFVAIQGDPVCPLCGYPGDVRRVVCRPQ